MQLFLRRFLLCMLLCMTIFVIRVPAYAVMETDRSDWAEQKLPFVPSKTSTWGDLVRHFEPEKYNALSADQREILNKTLLEEDNRALLLKREGKTSNTVMAFKIEQEDLKNEDFDARTRGFPFPINYSIGASPRDRYSINYWGSIVAYKQCPYMSMNMTLYDQTAGHYVTSASEVEFNSYHLSMNGTWSGQPNHSYSVKGIVFVTLPPGYVLLSPLVPLYTYVAL